MGELSRGVKLHPIYQQTIASPRQIIRSTATHAGLQSRSWMSASRDQRVDDALQQLVSRLIPPNADGDDGGDDQRWEEAIALARKLIGPTP